MQAEPYFVWIATVVVPIGFCLFRTRPFHFPDAFAHVGHSRIYVGDAETGHDRVIRIVVLQSALIAGLGTSRRRLAASAGRTSRTAHS